GIAISGSGTFFGTPTASRFGTYNSGTGAYSNIGNPAKPAGGGYGALDFNPDDARLYGLNVGSGSPPPTHIVVFNTATATITDLGLSVPSLDAIAFLPEPGSFALLAISAAILGATRRRPRIA